MPINPPHKPVTMVILAGGSSSRLWPLRDKSLLNFMGTSLLEHQISIYIEAGFRQIIVICNQENYLPIKDLTGNLSHSADFEIFVQEEPKGMGDALLKIKSVVEDLDAIYVCQVHDLFSPELHDQMLQAFNEEPQTSWLAAYRVGSYFPGGYLVLEENSKISSIIEKPEPGKEPSDLVNLVAHVHPNPARLLEFIELEYQDKSCTTDDHYERAMAKLMKKTVFKAVPYSGVWHPIKYPWHVLDVMGYFLHPIQEVTIHPTAIIEDGVSIVGPALISEGVRLYKGADLRGPVYIGPHSIVGQFSHVRQSMVESNCVIGLSSEVNRSYIGCGSMLHSSKALDSILAGSPDGKTINLSAGVITANLRGDSGNVKSSVKGVRVNTNRQKLGAILGAGAFIGINASLMPGVKIGEDSFVGPGTIVMEDIQNNKRCYVKQEIESN